MTDRVIMQAAKRRMRHPSETVVVRSNGYRIRRYQAAPRQPEPQMSTVRLLIFFAAMTLLWMPLIGWILQWAVGA